MAASRSPHRLCSQWNVKEMHFHRGLSLIDADSLFLCGFVITCFESYKDLMQDEKPCKHSITRCTCHF